MSSIRGTHHRKTESTGSIWTTLSDLFTSLAVVFLIMFVVVALKHSLAKLKVSSLDHDFKTFMQGNLPKKQEVAADKSKDQLQNSLNKLSATQETMLSRAKEMSKFVEQLNQHKVIMQDLLKDQQMRQAALAALKTQLEDSKEKVVQTNTQKTELEKTIQKERQQSNMMIAAKDRQIAELMQKIKMTENNVKQSQGKISAIQQEIAQRDQNIKSYQQDGEALKQQIANLKGTISGKDIEINKFKSRGYHKAVRRQLAERMSNRFKELGIDVDLDRATGKIFLRSNNNYLFLNIVFKCEAVVTEKIIIIGT